MANLSSLLDYYYESMYQDLKVLEADRLKIVSKLTKIGVVLVGITLLLTFILLKTNLFPPFEIISALIVGAVGIFTFIYRNESIGYRLLFKDVVIEKIIHFIDPSLIYQKSRLILENEYKRSELFLESYDRYQGSDLVSGKIKDVDVRFCDLNIEKKERDKDGKDHWHTIFQGLFFIADFNKHFTSKVVVLPDVAERAFGVVGSWMQGMNLQRGQLIKLDHVEFEKLFVVYGDNQIESRYILSHSLMQRMVDFHKKSGKNLYISFVDSKIYMALNYNKALFEPNLIRSLLEFNYIKDYFELLTMIISIVEEFKLNEKLWSKQ